MPPTRSAVPAVLAATVGLLLSLLAVAVVAPGTATAAPAAPAAGDRVGAPKKGDCSAMSLKQANGQASATRAVKCSKRHTTQVIAVKLLPKGTSYDDKPAVYMSKLSCGAAVAKVIGRNDKLFGLSRYQPFVFIPTKAQINDGARWYRCDLAILDGDHLNPLSKGKSAFPRLKAPLAAKIATCATRTMVVTCTSKHTLHSVFGFVVPGDPSDKKVAARANEVCGQRAPEGGYYVRRVGPKAVVNCLGR